MKGDGPLSGLGGVLGGQVLGGVCVVCRPRARLRPPPPGLSSSLTARYHMPAYMASASGGAVNMLQVSMSAWSLDAVDSLVTYVRRLDCSRCIRFITTERPSSPGVLSTAG
jgi:hypothetical protein